MPGAGGGHVSVGPAGRPRAGQHRAPARPAADDRQRQRHGIHIQRHPGLGRRDRGRLALHRAGQAPAERLQRELQRQAAGRVAERNAVPLAAPRPGRSGDLAAGLQRRAATFETRLDDAPGLRQRHLRKDRPRRARLLRSRAMASCKPPPGRFKSAQDSRYDWMRNGGHVRDNFGLEQLT